MTLTTAQLQVQTSVFRLVFLGSVSSSRPTLVAVVLLVSSILLFHSSTDVFFQDLG